ncbi:hypothetical protein [Methylomonas fluvii]|uniref:Uncharacterized protein n=1 Tax=Methylomonas fluvii TaxID=1854564 RepID=A0ABR9DCU7_9GAMM|nr:hypothetical protein [Methylomonas fluvii]MBD9360611.1 hypothetical protein [Methylomonas fluvii]CAD6873452.1 hypothetical protein [Methylomonas fluvii]
MSRLFSLKSTKALLPVSAILLGVLAGSAALAEPKLAVPGGEAIKKAQGMIRQLSQEKYALEAEKAAWLNEKATLEAKLKSLEATVGRLQALPAELERYKAGLEAVRGNLEAQLSQQRQREQALVQKHNEVVIKARDIRDDNNLLVQAVKEREQWIAQCTDLAQQLRKVNLDILNQYKEKGLLQQLAELDPLTGIGQVRTEAVAEEYRYKLQQLKITPFAATAPVAQTITPLKDGPEPVTPEPDTAETGQ